MIKYFNRIFMVCLTVMILLPFASCYLVPEPQVAQVTPKPTATGVTEPGEAPEANATITPSDNPVTTDGQGGELGVENTPVQGATEGTATAEPSATGNATVKPSATEKPTATVKPSATKTTAPTKKPTATPKKTTTPTKKPTATAQKEVYQTIEFEGKTYKVLMGRNGNPKLIKDYSTLPKILRAYAHPTFDKEAVMMDIYKYAKTKGFKYFYNPNVPLKTNPDTDLELPEAFVPGGNMTAELAEEAFSWYSPSLVTYLGDSAYTGDYEYTELDDIIYLRQSGFSMVDFLATDCTSLCLWIRDYGDSSNRKDYWDNGLYNGKVTKEYALYFMYGGRMSLVQEVKI